MSLKFLKFISDSPEKTMDLGRETGKLLNSGTTIAFKGDLGAGKTIFAKGLARGLNVPETFHITSPSYTIINEYPGRLPFFHIDLYRLEQDTDFEDIGIYEIFTYECVVAIEWADRLCENELEEYVEISLKATGDNLREICMIPYGLENENLIWRLEKIIKEKRWV